MYIYIYIYIYIQGSIHFTIHTYHVMALLAWSLVVLFSHS